MALPVFRELMLKMYGDGIAGPVPAFPDRMEQRITRYLDGDPPAFVEEPAVAATGVPRSPARPAELEWLRRNGTVFGPLPATPFSSVPLTSN